MRRSTRWPALLAVVTVSTCCVRYLENTGPEGVVETRPGSGLFTAVRRSAESSMVREHCHTLMISLPCFTLTGL